MIKILAFIVCVWIIRRACSPNWLHPKWIALGVFVFAIITEVTLSYLKKQPFQIMNLVNYFGVATLIYNYVIKVILDLIKSKI